MKRWLLGCLLALSVLSCGRDSPRVPADSATGDAPGTDGSNRAAAPAASSTAAEDGEWRIPAKNFASTRFSGLDQITADNVAQLQPAFSFSTGVLRGHEAAPIVAGNTMYVVTPHPNILYALDLSRDGALKAEGATGNEATGEEGNGGESGSLEGRPQDRRTTGPDGSR